MQYGIEYELEGAHHLERPNGWQVTHDGTLREGGIEVLFDGPATRRTSLARLGRLFANVEAAEPKPIASHRCGVHLHVDTRHLEGAQVLTLALGLLANEQTFFALSPERKRNHYCVPLLHSPSTYYFFDIIVRHYMMTRQQSGVAYAHVRHNRLPNNYKYMALNAMTLGTLRTLELRHFSPFFDTAPWKKIFNVIEGIEAVALEVNPTREVSFEFDAPEKDKEWVRAMWNQYTGGAD